MQENYTGFQRRDLSSGRYDNGRDLVNCPAISTPARVIFGDYPVQFDVRTAVNGHTIYRVDAYFRGGDSQDIGVYHDFRDFIDDIPDAIKRVSTTSKRKPSGILVSGRLSVDEIKDISARLDVSGVRDVSFISSNVRFVS